MRRIDCHAHVLPPAYRRLLGDMPIPPGRLEDYEAVMARYGIDRAVISTGPPGAFSATPAARASSRASPTRASPRSSAAPRRFAGLATLPLPDVDAALRGAGVRARRARARRRDAALQRRRAPTSATRRSSRCSPSSTAARRTSSSTRASRRTRSRSHHPVWLYEFPFDTVRALANLVYSGALERHQRIRGRSRTSAARPPMLAHRLASLADREPELARAVRRPARSSTCAACTTTRAWPTTRPRSPPRSS